MVALALAVAMATVGMASAQAVRAPDAPADSTRVAAAGGLGDVAGMPAGGRTGTGGGSSGARALAGGVDAQPVLTSPIDPLRARRLFDPPPKPWNAGHRGIDLVAEPGDEVRSPGSGTIAFVGVVVNRPLLSIDLDVGLRATLEPVTTTLSEGERVARGQTIGMLVDTVGDPSLHSPASAEYGNHCTPEVCVHWGLRRGEVYVNPLDWLVGYGPIRLLPLTED